MADDGNDSAIVGSTIDLAHYLRLTIVAEGVEDQSIWDSLAALGCDLAQGFHQSHPLPSADVAIWLRASSAVRLEAHVIPALSHN